VAFGDEAKIQRHGAQDGGEGEQGDEQVFCRSPLQGRLAM